MKALAPTIVCLLLVDFGAAAFAKRTDSRSRKLECRCLVLFHPVSSR